MLPPFFPTDSHLRTHEVQSCERYSPAVTVSFRHDLPETLSFPKPHRFVFSCTSFCHAAPRCIPYMLPTRLSSPGSFLCVPHIRTSSLHSFSYDWIIDNHKRDVKREFGKVRNQPPVCSGYRQSPVLRIRFCPAARSHSVKKRSGH